PWVVLQQIVVKNVISHVRTIPGVDIGAIANSKDACRVVRYRRALRPQAVAWGWRRCAGWGRCWRRRRTRLDFKRTDVDPAIYHAIKTRTALIKDRRRSKVRVTGIKGRTTRQQRVRKCGATVVLQRTEHRVGVDLITGTS